MMTAKSKALLLVTSAIGFVGLMVWFALPYPWVPFGKWLESFFKPTDQCFCFWPWWLFVIVHWLASLLMGLWIRASKQGKQQAWAWYMILGVLVYSYHSIAHQIILKENQICHESVYTQWFWLMVIVSVSIFGLMTKSKKA